MNLLYKHEKPLFTLSLIISSIFWFVLIIATFGTALIYILFFVIFYLFAQSALISYIKGTAVKITKDQFPDLHEKLLGCSKKLGINELPDTYMLHADGAFNAFATRFLGRNFVVLFSDIVDALEAHSPSLCFYIGHELGHIQRKHLIWGPVLFPASMLPLIGAAYSRAREYTCDNYGFACCEKPVDAVRGLAALSAGGKRWRTLKIERYIDQAKDSGGFWMSFNELISDYPWLVKRMARVYMKATSRTVDLPKRNPFAWFLALFIPRTGYAAGGASIFVVIAIVGILAAIAIPNFTSYRNKALEASIEFELQNLHQIEAQYYAQNQTYTGSLDELEYTSSSPGITIEIVDADSDCFQAKGSHDRLKKDIWIDCNGETSER